MNEILVKIIEDVKLAGALGIVSLALINGPNNELFDNSRDSNMGEPMMTKFYEQTKTNDR